MPRDDWQRARNRDIGRRADGQQRHEAAQRKANDERKRHEAREPFRSKTSRGIQGTDESRAENEMDVALYDLGQRIADLEAGPVAKTSEPEQDPLASEERMIRLANLDGLSLEITRANTFTKQRPFWRFRDADRNHLVTWFPESKTLCHSRAVNVPCDSAHLAYTLARWLIGETDAHVEAELRKAKVI